MSGVSAESCAFCDTDSLAWRTIRADELFVSFVSSPSFTPNHCLVIPNRHITTLEELQDDESAAIMGELGRLSLKLDEGFGAGMMQKFQPRQDENGIKVNHLHFHVFPRQEYDDRLFPVPYPNDFSGFTHPVPAGVIELADRLK